MYHKSIIRESLKTVMPNLIWHLISHKQGIIKRVLNEKIEFLEAPIKHECIIK